MVGPVDAAIDPGVVTPTTEGLRMPSAEVLAHALDTALRPGRPLKRVPAWVATLAAFLAGGGLALFLRQVRPLAGAVLTLVALGAYGGIALVLFRHERKCRVASSA